MKNRRSFLRKASTAGLALTALPTIPLAVADSFSNASFLSPLQGSKLRIGLIGLGERGTTHLKNLLGHQQVEIVAMNEDNPAAMRKALQLVASHHRPKPQLFFNKKDAHLRLLEMDGLDAVVISTPARTHYQMTMEALRAGKHVACELIMGKTVAEHEDIVGTSRQVGRQYMSLDPTYFRRDLEAIQHMVGQGLFGQMEQLTVGSYHLYHPGDEWTPPQINKFKKLEGHGLGMASRLIGQARPISVSTVMETQEEYAYPVMGKKGSKHVAIGKMSMPVSTVDFGHGQVRIQHTSQTPATVSVGYHLRGTQGAYMDVTDSLFLGNNSEEHVWSQAQPILDEYAAGGSVGYLYDTDARMIQSFVDALLHQRPMPIAVEEAAVSGVLSHLAQESIALGGADVTFPDFASTMKALV